MNFGFGFGNFFFDIANKRAILFVFTSKAAYIIVELIAGINLITAQVMIVSKPRTVMYEVTLPKTIPANMM